MRISSPLLLLTALLLAAPNALAARRPVTMPDAEIIPVVVPIPATPPPEAAPAPEPETAAPAPKKHVVKKAAPKPAEKTDKKKDTPPIAAPAKVAPKKPAAEKPVAKKAVPEKTVAAAKPAAAVAAAAASGAQDDATLPVAADLDEGVALPVYPEGAREAMGENKTWVMGEEDTLLDVARHFNLGYVEMRAANPDVDAWASLPGTDVTVPSFRILPRAKQEGIVVNLAEMRLYYFRTPGAPPETMPIGIGRDGLMTPLGETEIVRKVDGPTWYPTPRMREESPFLPAAVPPGPMNPLGTHALYLGWPEFRIHGSNKPWAIGRRVSSGCMRLYPEDISKLFNETPVGTKVTVVEQPILVAKLGKKVYLEANPSRTQSNQLEIDGEFQPKDMTDAMRAVIVKAAGVDLTDIDWAVADKVVHERRGLPTLIADLDGPAPAVAPKPAPKKSTPKETTPAPKKPDAKPHYNR